ncbi:hypothetical protein ACFLQN_03140 [Candidatus Aenigmatarchaeota archaeon]
MGKIGELLRKCLPPYGRQDVEESVLTPVDYVTVETADGSRYAFPKQATATTIRVDDLFSTRFFQEARDAAKDGKPISRERIRFYENTQTSHRALFEQVRPEFYPPTTIDVPSDMVDTISKRDVR